MCLTSLSGACLPAPDSQYGAKALDWESEAWVLSGLGFSIHKLARWGPEHCSGAFPYGGGSKRPGYCCLPRPSGMHFLRQGFILRFLRATELPLTSWEPGSGTQHERPGCGVRQMGPISWESQLPSLGLSFPSIKWVQSC